jgi:hypothetical protein
MISDRTKIRDGVVTNRPVYLAIGIDCDGAKQFLGPGGTWPLSAGGIPASQQVQGVMVGMPTAGSKKRPAAGQVQWHAGPDIVRAAAADMGHADAGRAHPG